MIIKSSPDVPVVDDVECLNPVEEMEFANGETVSAAP